MATISHRRSTSQNLSHIRLGSGHSSRAASDGDINDINNSISYLNKAKMATSQAQLFANVSEAFRILYRLSKRHKP